ncbi:MAG: YecA family protein, partial [Rudaea sp.]
MNEDFQQIERPGKDDPCWCGSGQEYRKCHRRSDQEAAESQAHRGELLVHLQEYAMQPDLRDELQAAISFFYGPEQSVQNEDDDEDRLFSLQRGLDYFIHDCRLGDSRRVIEHFSRERGKRLLPPVRSILKRWLHSRLAVYEVIDIRDGQVLLRDLLTQEEYWVHDLDMSKGVNPWDLILTRLFPTRDTADTSGIGLHMPARFRDWIRSYVMDLWEEYRERHENESYEDFLHASAQLLNQFVLGEVEDAMNQVPNLVTREGDLVEACQARFRVLDFALALAGLRGAEEFKEATEEEDDEKHFIWVDAGESFELLREHGPEIDPASRAAEGGERLLGHVWLDEQELELET